MMAYEKVSDDAWNVWRRKLEIFSFSLLFPVCLLN